MSDEEKTTAEPIEELQEMRQRLGSLVAANGNSPATTEPLWSRGQWYKIVADHVTDLVWAATIEGLGEVASSTGQDAASVDVDALLDHWRFEYVSPSVERILGYSAEELARLKPKEILTARAYRSAKVVLAQGLADARMDPEYTHFESPVELEHVAKDGTTRWCELTTRFLRDQDKQIVGILGVTRDITDRRKAEEAVRANEEKLRAISKSALDAVVVIDETGKVAHWNPAAEKMFGYLEEEILGQNAHELLAPAGLRERAKQGIQRFRESGQGPAVGNVLELEAVRKDGSQFPIEIAVAPIKIDDRWWASAIIRDITERRRSQEALARASDELRRSNKDLEQFAYAASHDLQEPLRTVRSFLQLLVRDYEDRLDARARELIDFAADGAARMERLIGDLFDYSRVGTHGRASEVVDCNELVDSVVRNLRTTIDENKAQIRAEQLPQVLADPGQLTELFQNLISNAIKFRRDEGPRIVISALETGDEWTFSIRDNGIGIEPEYADRVFEVFQRLHTREEFPGTGIGLAICKRIVERHGGRIWFESQLGLGTTFYFTLPTTRRNGRGATFP
jgi:PAS domain S-box-containing protein